MSHSLIFGIDTNGEQKPVSTSTSGEVNIVSGGSALATATNQTTTHTKLDSLITTLGDVDLNTDTLETLQTSTNTKLDTVNTNLGLQATATNQATTHTKLDSLIATLGDVDLNTDTLETLQTSTNTKLDAVNTNLSSQATATNQATTHTKLDTVNTNLGLLATETTLSTQSGTITTINGKMSQGSDASLTNAQQVLVYGRDAVGGLDALNVDTQGHLKITIQDSEKDITSATLWSSQVIADATTANTTAVDMLNHKHIQFYGNTNNTMDNIDIQVSDDNSNWYRLGVFIYPDTNTGDFGYTLNHSSVRYVRLIKSNTSGASETITAKYTMMKF